MEGIIFSHRSTQMHTDKSRRRRNSHLCASVPHLWLIFLFLIAARFAKAAEESAAGPWTVPILEIRYFPVTAEGKKIDINVTSNVGSSLETIRAKCDRMTKQTMEALSEGSRFHAYSNPAAKPSITFKVLETKEYLEPLP